MNKIRVPKLAAFAPAVKTLFLVAAFAPIFGITASAGLLSVDFNGGDFGQNPGITYSGAAVTGSTGDHWNGFNSSQNTLASAPLTDSTNTLTPITLSYSGVQQYNGTSSPFNGTPYENLMREFLIVGGGSSKTFTLANLPASSAFTLYLYSASDDGGNGRVTNFALDAANGGGTSSVTFNKTVNVFTAGTNYTILNGTTDAAGTVKFSILQNGGGEGDMNGFQINVVPEPGTVTASVVAGLVGLFAVHRRRRIV